ncbi:MAG: serine hydrolase [Anaerolineaceae bacterium]
MKLQRFSLLRWIAIGLLVLSVIILVLQLVRFSRLRAGFPAGTVIANIPVGGLDQQGAADRVIQAYNYPIEVHYGSEVFYLKPTSLGFELNIDTMIAAADQQRVNAPFWGSFWDYLWNRSTEAQSTPLAYSINEKQLKMYLYDEISSRYDNDPEQSQPVAGSTNFKIGTPGEVLDVDASIPFVEQALQSSSTRIVNLVVTEVDPPKPSLENLEVLLKQLIDKSDYDGLSEVYVLDLESGKEIDFAYENGVDYDPGISFTAASTIKIPIMVTTFQYLPEPTSQAAAELMQLMIEQSKNDPADELMETYLSPTLGPLIVTDTMQQLGLENTFLAGHFYIGAPLLQRFTTPANTRTDYTTDPDIYNQTTPADMGMLLEDIYQCAKNGGGTFGALFPNEITQNECQTMITYLTNNKIAVLLQAGLPDGTRIGHKHGWITEADGLMHAIFDVGIVFSPAGDYVICVAMYHPVQLIFDSANLLTANISIAVYNYFNIE